MGGGPACDRAALDVKETRCQRRPGTSEKDILFGFEERRPNDDYMLMREKKWNLKAVLRTLLNI